MAKTAEEEAYKDIIEALATTPPEFIKPGWDSGVFFKQRSKQRSCLFWFAIITSSVSLVFLITIVAVQIYYRIKLDHYFEILSDRGLEILAVAVFGQVFGVVYIIANALWSNDEFKIYLNEKK